MQRLLFLIPNVESARNIVDELLLARFEQKHIHVIANDRTVLKDIPAARLWQKSDLIPSFERGLVAGGGVGLVAAFLLIAVNATERVLANGGIILACVLMGAAIGAWISTLIGIRLPHRRIAPFEDAINKGQLLMMVDAPAGREDEVVGIIKHHPQADLKDTSPGISEFP